MKRLLIRRRHLGALGLLPQGYKRLEYIYCDERQYIDTGLKGDETISASIDVQLGFGGRTHSVFGCFAGKTGYPGYDPSHPDSIPYDIIPVPGATKYNSFSPNSLSLTFSAEGGALRVHKYYWAPTWTTRPSGLSMYGVSLELKCPHRVNWTGRDPYTGTITPPYKPGADTTMTYWWNNDSDYLTPPETWTDDFSRVQQETFVTPDNLLIGYNYSPYPAFAGAIGRITIWSGEIVVRDYIPAKRISDGEVGLFELVERRFCASDGILDGTTQTHYYEYVSQLRSDLSRTAIPPSRLGFTVRPDRDN